MEKKIFIFLVILLACGVLLDPVISQAKIGVIIHDHGAPGKYDSTQDPYLAHDDNAYYGVKQFLRHLIMMKVIPNIVICADLHGDSDSCDGNTYYAPENYYKGFYNANYECVEQGGGSGGLNCYRDSDCDAPDTCKVSLNLEDSTSTATEQGASDAYLTDTTQDFSPYKDGNHVILAGIGAGNWWGFIGTEPLGDDTTVYIYNDPSRTARGWCGGTTPNSNTKRYWLREDPTPFIDVWGDPPLSDDYASLQFRQKDNHYGEHYRFLNAGPGYTSPPSGPDKNFDEWGGIDYYYGWSGDMGGYEPYFFQIYPQMNNVRDTIWANYKTLLTGNPSLPDSDKEVYIRSTQGVDYQFSEDPTAGVCEENGGGTSGTACFSDGDCNGPDTYNPNQKDSDRDGLGDCCDPSPGCGGNGEPTCDSYCEASTTTTADTTTTTTTIPCSLEAIYREYSQKTELLRNFRDNVLSQSPEGQEIIRLYYEWSPMIVKAMEEDEEFKKGMKAMIDGVLLLIDNQVE